MLHWEDENSIDSEYFFIHSNVEVIEEKMLSWKLKMTQIISQKAKLI